MQRPSPRFRSQKFFLWKICGETFSPDLQRFVWRRHASSVGGVTVDLIRRSWVRFPPRSKDFFFTSRGSLIPFTRANAQWVIHGFNQHLNLHFRVNSLFHLQDKEPPTQTFLGLSRVAPHERLLNGRATSVHWRLAFGSKKPIHCSVKC